MSVERKGSLECLEREREREKNGLSKKEKRETKKRIEEK